MTENLIQRYPDADALAKAAAAAAITRLQELTKSQDVVHIGLTGGTVGIMTLACWSAHPERDSIDYSKVHFWWGDERFVDQDSGDRNFIQAWDALLANIEVPFENLHEFPSSSDGLSLDEAREEFEREFKLFSPVLDFALMGMGPDGHVASLFPDHENLETQGLIIAEHDSPKPPSKRLSLSYAALNSSTEIWFLIAGADKANPLASAFSDSSESLPVGKVSGTACNRWFIDEAAGAALKSN